MIQRLRVAILAAVSLPLLATSGPAVGEQTYIASLDTRLVSQATIGAYSQPLDSMAHSDRQLDASLPTSFSTPAPRLDADLSGMADEADVRGPDAAILPGKTLSATVTALKGEQVEVDRQLHCLATAVYHESKGEPLEGQLAVAQVILNRVESGRFADSVCGVVHQPKQFSFVGQNVKRRSANAWDTAVAVARIARQGSWRQVAPNALFFHATYASPSWRMVKQKIAAVGMHIFYR
jgi:hypothetical protein